MTSRFEEITSALPIALLSERGGQLVSTPRSTDEVAALLRSADAHGVKVEIAGAGTKRGWAGPPAAELLLEARGLHGVREHSWQDLTASVGAGTAWAEVQRVLAQHGQMVALDPLWADRATVGGVVATNDSGSLRLKYGSLRDLIIGMTLVLPDGTIARSGGKVVKNVAGYDLHKLMIGAYGTLAVITDVTFRLHSIPRQTRVRSTASTDASALGKRLMKLLNSHLDIHAMQLRTSAGGFALDVELTGIEQSAEADLAGTVVTEATPLFGARENLFAGEGVIVKATMLVSAIAFASAAVARLGGAAVTQASGIMLARFNAASAQAAIAELQTLVQAAGEGTVTLLRGADGFGAPSRVASAAPLMREIKHKFDPNSILNPVTAVGA